MVLLVSGALTTHAAEKVLDLTLEKAVQMALRKNFAIEVERFEPQIARERERSAYGRFDPAFDLSYRRGESAVGDQFLRNTRNDAQHFSFRSVNQNTTWSTGVSGVTQWGLGYDVGLRTATDGGTFNRFGEDISTEASFSVSQPLLRGFGPAANLAGIRVARNNVLVSEWSLRQQVMQTITNVIVIYNDLHFSRENLLVAERSKALANQLLRDNIKRVEIGVKTPLDVTTARAEAASREEAVIRARREMFDAENFLKQLITGDVLPLLGTHVTIQPPSTLEFTANVLSGIGQALELRPDYRQAKLDIENRNITLAFEKNQKLPRLDLTASLSMLGLDNDLGTSVQRVGARDQSAWSAGAIFSIPLGNREAIGRVNAAQLQSAQALVSLQQLEQAIIVQVDNANGAVTTARQRIEATTEASKLARESLSAGEARLVAGTGTTFEVLELQKKLAEAETSELQSRADYHKAIARYHLQTGSTLKVHQVKVE